MLVGLLLNDSDNQSSREAEYIELMYSKNVEGIILANAAGEEREVLRNMRLLSEKGFRTYLWIFPVRKIAMS